MTYWQTRLRSASPRCTGRQMRVFNSPYFVSGTAVTPASRSASTSTAASEQQFVNHDTDIGRHRIEPRLMLEQASRVAIPGVHPLGKSPSWRIRGPCREGRSVRTKTPETKRADAAAPL